MTVLEFIQDYYVASMEKAEKEGAALEVGGLASLQQLILVGEGYEKLRKESLLSVILERYTLENDDSLAISRLPHARNQKDISSGFEVYGRNEDFVFYLQELCRILNQEQEEQIDVCTLEIDAELLALQSYMHLFQTGDINEIFGGFFSFFTFKGEWMILAFRRSPSKISRSILHLQNS